MKPFTQSGKYRIANPQGAVDLAIDIGYPDAYALSMPPTPSRERVFLGLSEKTSPAKRSVRLVSLADLLRELGFIVRYQSKDGQVEALVLIDRHFRSASRAA